MEKRVEYGWLLDFYGALLTEHRLQVMRMYLEEDLSLQEIADAMGITRQGVHDAINHAQKQLEAYEAKLGLLSRYRRLTEAVGECRTELDRAISGEDAQADDRALFIDAAAVSCGGTRRNMHEGQLLHALAEVAVLCVTAAGYLPAVYIRPGDAPYYPAFYLYQMI